MDVSSINSQTNAMYSQQSAGSGELGKQEFLQLLVAQMRNQDPINPLDGTQFATQLAQFNSVEQLINVNDSLETLQMSQELMSASLTNSLASSLTGKYVKALSNEIDLQAGGEADINFKLNTSADEVEVIIRTEGGTEVRRETLKGVASGDNNWTWDGYDSNGNPAGEGNYTVEVVAKNGENESNALVYTQGLASKVRYTASGVFLTVNGIEVSIGDVEEGGTAEE
mgnify:CR=1 FL=1